MKYLNIGCGRHYSTSSVWTNLDFISTGEGVIAHNLLQGVPFADESFDVVYHSHVLEHFSKQDGEKLIIECFRVLKPQGILRIAIPDLEMIAKNYLKFLNEGMANPEDKMIRANYEWMLLEMYDQTTRNEGGGNMGKYLKQENIINEDFVFERIGGEGLGIREDYLNSVLIKPQAGFINALKKIKRNLKSNAKSLFKRYTVPYDIGRFRLGGEIHQWMYDRYSLTHLLQLKGGANITVCDAFTSFVAEWPSFEIDGRNAVIRKPDSLFIEAIKK